MKELISVVVPMYFEESVAEECYTRLVSVFKTNNLNYELIFVNDGSTDKTLEILKKAASENFNVKVISFSRNFGHQIAVTAGIDKAKGDAIIIIDADLQDPPELIPDMIKLWKDGHDVVYAKRKRREGESWFKLFSAKAFYRLLNRMTDVVIPADTGDFRLIDRKVAEVFKRMPEKNRFIRGMVSWLGFKQIPIEYERKERFAGTTKYPIKKMIKFALDGIISFSSRPLKLIEYTGFISILISFCALIYSIITKILITGDMAFNWGLILTIIPFFAGIQLLAIGMLGEYVFRIHDESIKRPLYIIEEEFYTTPLTELTEITQNIDDYNDNTRKIV